MEKQNGTWEELDTFECNMPEQKKLTQAVMAKEDGEVKMGRLPWVVSEYASVDVDWREADAYVTASKADGKSVGNVSLRGGEITNPKLREVLLKRGHEKNKAKLDKRIEEYEREIAWCETKIAQYREYIVQAGEHFEAGERVLEDIAAQM